MSKKFFFFVLLGLALPRCQTIAVREKADVSLDVPTYSEAHLDFKKNDRGAQCCTARGKKFAIATGSVRSAQCGKEILEAGGNLVDAAVAAAFCLGVERPHSAGIGGTGFLLFHRGASKEDFFVDFRGTAPVKSTAEMFLDKRGDVVPELSRKGGLATAVPTFVAGFFEVHKKWGSMKWARVLEPAARLAAGGFPVYPSLEEKIAQFKDELLKDPYLARTFVPEGKPLKAGDSLVQSELADTINVIGRQGKFAFYRGAIGKDVVRAVQANGGILEDEDLKKYQVKSRQPLRGNYHGVTFVTAPPPSAGGMILLQTLNVLAGFDLKKEPSYSHYLKLLAESLKHGFANRSKYIGDPDFFADKTYLSFIDPKYGTELSQSIESIPRAESSEKIRPADLSPTHESPDTSHLSLMDSEGNAISSTITVNDYFGAKFSVPNRGIILNDEMDDFSAKPGKKNLFGLTGDVANQIQPDKRPVSSMMPTIALRGGKPILALGAPGGSFIVSGVTQVISNYFSFYPGDLRRSVFAPRLHHQWVPDKLYIEAAGFPVVTIEALEHMGYSLEKPFLSSLVTAVAWEEAEKDFIAVSDPRDTGGTEAD
jgi:gamma-glutamyltranspeptidase / glutathione hydrolase